MLGMHRNSKRKPKDAPAGGKGQNQVKRSFHGTRSLTGDSDIISLDGKSLLLPDRDAYPDEVSSMNSTLYAGGTDLKIVSRIPPNPQTEDEMVPPAVPGMLNEDGSLPKEMASAIASNEPDEPKKGQSRGCLPLWIQRAPTWLKLLLLTSLLLLIAALALVGVGLALSMPDDDNNNNNSQKNDNFGGFPTTKSTPPPVSIPTPAPAPVETKPKTSPETSKKTAAPTPSPPVQVTPSTSSPTEPVDLEVTTFYVTAGQYLDDALQQAQEGLPLLPTHGGTAFLVHLGDWNLNLDCPEDVYQNVAQFFQASSVPVYFAVGDNEYNGTLRHDVMLCCVEIPYNMNDNIPNLPMFLAWSDCANPELAILYWEEYLVDYETRYWEQPSWDIWRQGGGFQENWVFNYNRVIFCGINLVAGTEHDADEWAARHEENLDFISENYRFNRRRNIDVFVIFAHAAPQSETDDSPNAIFYETLFEDIRREYDDMEFVLVHRNLASQEEPREVEQFDGIPNLTVITAVGSTWPPMRVQIDLRERNPITIEQAI